MAACETLAGRFCGGFADGVGALAQFDSPEGLGVDKEGNIFVADSGNHRIRRITPEGVTSTFAGSGEEGFADGAGAAAQFNYPTGVAADSDGNIFVADRDNHRIRRITPDGVTSTFAGSGEEGFADGVGLPPSSIAQTAWLPIATAASSSRTAKTIASAESRPKA